MIRQGWAPKGLLGIVIAAGLGAASSAPAMVLRLNPCAPCVANPRVSELIVGFANDALVLHTELRVSDCGDRALCGSSPPDCGFDPLAWNPPGIDDCDGRPLLSDPRSVWGPGFVHFKILSPDGACMYFNSRLEGADAGGDLVMRLPIGEVLTESNVAFYPCSDFARIVIDPYEFTDFSLVAGESYMIEITEQLTVCASLDEQERILARKVITIPHLTAWCGVEAQVQ